MTMPAPLRPDAIAVERCKASDILTIGEGTPPAIIEALDSYFATFAKPTRKDGKMCCTNCGAPLDGVLHALGAGAAAVWSIRHGEATCSACRWPMRGMHYPKDAAGEELMSLRNFFLSYHPDEVTRAEPQP